MQLSPKTGLVLIIATLWIALNEFGRNQIVLLSEWERHYANLGMNFQTTPLNGLVWLGWSFALAALILTLSTKFRFGATLGLTFVASFGMMWLVIFNLGVLPFGILPLAVPWSLLEIAGAWWLIHRINPRP